jgi:hypothetical protein
MSLKICSIAAAVAFVFATAAQAQTTPNTPRADPMDRGASPAPKVDRKAKKAEEDRIEAEYKADKAKCNALKGNEKEVCEADAKGKERIAKAELEQKFEPSPRHQRKVDEAKAEHEYHVAKEKCDAMKGKDENTCEKEAKAKFERAKADIKQKYAGADDKRASTSGATRAPADQPAKRGY